MASRKRNRGASVASPTGPTPAAPRAAVADWGTRLLPLVLLVLVGLGAYSNCFDGAFVYDDLHAIVGNRQVQQLGPVSVADLLRPRGLTDLTFRVNYALGGQAVWGYHAVNLAVHLLAGLVLYGLVRRTLLLDPWRPRFEGSAAWMALAAAALWLVHPLQTESVTYIVQRAEALAGLFCLLTLYCLLRSATGNRHRRLWGVAAVVSCLLALLSKEVGCVAPALALLYDRTFLAGSFAGALRRRWGLYAGLAATGLVLTPQLRLLFTPSSPAAAGVSRSVGFAIQGVSWQDYFSSQPGVMLHYLRLALWPDRLCLDYAWPVARGPAEVVPAALAVGVLLLCTLWALVCRPWLGFLGAWFFLCLAPTSSVVPLSDLAVEHRLYLALVAVAVLTVLAGQAALSALTLPDRQRAWLAGGLVAALSVALAFRTARRNEDYHNPLALWAGVVAQRPANHRAHNNLGLLLEEQGRSAEAARHFLEAIRLSPTYAKAYVNLGLSLMKRRQPGAEEAFLQALRFDPNLAIVHNNLGNLLMGRGDYERAVFHLREAARLAPQDHLPYGNLGMTFQLQEKWAEAAEAYRQALAREPGNAEYHRGLAFVLSRLGRREESRLEYAESLRLNPRWPEAALRDAWGLATSPDPARRHPVSLQFALQAVEAAGERDARALDVLAAAYAEAGRYAEAVETARRARGLAGRAALARDIEGRIRLYQSRRPFRTPGAGR